MFTSSGLIVRFLKVFEQNNYHSVKWVRYLTKASGTYQVRVRIVSLVLPLNSPLLTHAQLYSSDVVRCRS